MKTVRAIARDDHGVSHALDHSASWKAFCLARITPTMDHAYCDQDGFLSTIYPTCIACIALEFK